MREMPTKGRSDVSVSIERSRCETKAPITSSLLDEPAVEKVRPTGEALVESTAGTSVQGIAGMDGGRRRMEGKDRESRHSRAGPGDEGWLALNRKEANDSSADVIMRLSVAARLR